MSDSIDTTMFKPSLRSPQWLAVLAIVAVGLYILAEHSKRQVQLPNYEVKLDAAKRMNSAIAELRKFRLGADFKADAINDPNLSTLVGRQESPITTEDGRLEWVLTSINPNIAATVVAYIVEANIKEGDKVAVTLNGSYPGLNIATICALEAMKVEPVIISSVGSAQWGANDPNFTWLDMETVLYKAGKINHRSVAASLGGGGDYGRGLSDRGRQMLRDAITRNGVEKIEVNSLDSSIQLRIQKFTQLCGGKPKLFITVGGGAAAIGHAENALLIPTGYFANLPARNYPNIGVLHLLADQGVPFIHLYDMHVISTDFELPKSPVPMPEPGNGGVFSTIRYDVRIAGLVLFIYIIVIGLVIRHDRKQYILTEEGADPDTLPMAK